ncbi:hypothetical protein BDY24DRAFT_415690 [Mrakia frigida]|uniref:uncharacterized protein n=1 Tax=Mrakia frigida TaxID=29902 RepID=UPI003FCC0D2E
MPVGEDVSYRTSEAAKTYFPNGYTMSLAMRRARRRYFWPNVRGCIVLTIFGGAVYFYSLEAVAQDDFEDLTSLIPSPTERSTIPSLEELDASRAEKTRRRKQAQLDLKTDLPYATNPNPTSAALSGTTQEWGSFGLGPKLSYYWPKGKEEGLIAGAPKVDQLGRIGDRTLGSVGGEGVRRI